MKNIKRVHGYKQKRLQFAPHSRNNGNCQTPLLPYEHYRALYTSSFFALMPALYGFYREYWFLALMPSSVFITSINYWSYPTYCWRRNVDIIWVCSTSVYQALLASKLEDNQHHFLVFYSCLFLYTISSICLGSKKMVASTTTHVMTHILGSIGTVIFYMEDIPSQFLWKY